MWDSAWSKRMVDRIEYMSSDGEQHELTVAEFLALPLFERMQGVVERRFRFYAGERALAPDDALVELRMAQPRSTSAGPLQVRSQDDDHTLGSCDGVLISVWRNRFSVDVVERLGHFRKELYPFLGTLHIAEASTHLPASAEREAMARVFSERTASSPPVALVLVGGGFGVSALRGVATAVFAMRPDVPKRIFAEVTDAIPWLTDQMGRPELNDRLREAVANGRRVVT